MRKQDGQKTILVVEDDQDLSKLMHRFLDDHGYRVLLAADGQRGVEEATAAQPDLVLLDIKLPKKDGELVALELRGQQATASIPIIMMTAVTDVADKHLIAQLGIYDYVEKPFDPDYLLSKIRALLQDASSQPA